MRALRTQRRDRKPAARRSDGQHHGRSLKGLVTVKNVSSATPPTNFVRRSPAFNFNSAYFWKKAPIHRTKRRIEECAKKSNRCPRW